MTAGKLYVRPVEGCRGHVIVGITTAHLGRVHRVEQRAFGRMIAPGSLATFNVRKARWERLHSAYQSALESWRRVWGME